MEDNITPEDVRWYTENTCRKLRNYAEGLVALRELVLPKTLGEKSQFYFGSLATMNTLANVLLGKFPEIVGDILEPYKSGLLTGHILLNPDELKPEDLSDSQYPESLREFYRKRDKPTEGEQSTK